MYNSLKIDDALSLMLKRTGLAAKFDEAKVLYTAKKLLSAYAEINLYIRKVSLKNKMLYITVSSSAAKNELLYKQSAIIDAINSAAGQQVVEKIVLFS